MYLIILGISLGLVIGAFLQFDIPAEYARYTAVAIIGVLDSIFGAIKASIGSKYDTTIFLTGLAFNMVLAVFITFIGDKLSLDLYLAVLVVFMIRILSNIGIIRTATLDRWHKKQPK